MTTSRDVFKSWIILAIVTTIMYQNTLPKAVLLKFVCSPLPDYFDVKIEHLLEWLDLSRSKHTVLRVSLGTETNIHCSQYARLFFNGTYLWDYVLKRPIIYIFFPTTGFLPTVIFLVTYLWIIKRSSQTTRFILTSLKTTVKCLIYILFTKKVFYALRCKYVRIVRNTKCI